MATNYLVNVPRLKGRENYSEWTFAAENFLVLEGMLHCIRPVAGKTIDVADDEKTKAKLIMTIDSTLYVHIKNVSTTRELWNKLRSLFDDSGFTSRISLLRMCDSVSPEPPDPSDPIDTVMTPQPTASKRRLVDSDLAPPPKKTIINREVASASIQHIYTHSEWTILGVRNYTDTDSGSYIVHVSLVDSDPASGITIKSIGKVLFQNNIKNVCQDGLKKVGRNKISVSFKSAAAANKFIEHPVLKNNNYEANIPTYNVTRMGLVRGVPVDWSMDEFVESVHIPTQGIKILKARRLSRKIKEGDQTKWEPTQTVVLTFRGQQLP